MKLRNLYLIRHGQSVYNLENRFTGWKDVELTSLGESQAKEAGKILSDIDFDYCYISNLKRAKHTLQFILNEINQSPPIENNLALNERDYGDLIGQNKAEAAEKFGEMVAELGGPNSFMENWSRFLPEAPVILEVEAPDSGIILGWDSEALGLAVVNLGGGRKVETDKINPSVGLSNIIATGEKIEQGKVILRIHASRLESAEKVKTSILSAVKIGSKPPKRRNLVIEKIE